MLPAGLRAALSARLEGVSRGELAQRAATISEHYRQGRSSAAAIRDPLDALAYAVVRLPATYAACIEAFRHTAAALPDFAPAALLDLGAGPGTASHAALACWPGLARIAQVEANPRFRELALRLGAATGEAVLADLHRSAGDLAGSALPELAGRGVPPDLVVASYVLVELAPAAVTALASRLAASGARAIVLIEPGTPAGFQRLRLAREAMLAAGLAAVAPCPGNVDCPMAGVDWCHFSARLPRLKDHRLAKGADAPFEDERFAYLAVARTPLRTPSSRVLAAPHIGKAESRLKLCTPRGLEHRTVPRRDKEAWKRVRKLTWGDAID